MSNTIDPIEERKKQVFHLFSLTGQDLVNEVLTKFRGGETGPTAEMRARDDIEDYVLNGRNWYKIRSRTARPTDLKKIMYIHGGGFVLESGLAELLFAEYLANETGAEVWFPEYPLAPEHTCVDALDMVFKLYQMMLTECSADEIALAGGSAGGCLAPSLAIELREKGVPQPRCLVLLSPGADMRAVRPEEEEYMALLASRDKMISPKAFTTIHGLWGGGLPEDDYRVTPAAADLHGLPPMLIFGGTGEVVGLSALRLKKAAEKQGIPYRYYEKEMMPHCWVLFPEFDTTEERALILQMLRDPASVVG